MNVNQDRTETERYCINCLYNLRGLPEHRCPECGQTFDPDDTTTFLPTPDPLKRQTMLDPSVGFWWGGVSCVLLCICFALATPRRPSSPLKKSVSLCGQWYYSDGGCD